MTRKHGKVPKLVESDTISNDTESTFQFGKQITFMKWCKDNGIVFNDQVEVTTAGVCSNYGMVATDKISEGSVIVTIPRGCILHAETSGLKNLLESDKLLQGDDCSPWVKSLIAVLYESVNPTSLWHSYLDLFLHTNSLDLPLFWDDETLDAELTCTGTLDIVKRDKQRIRNDFHKFVLPFVRKYPELFPSDNARDLMYFRKIVAFVMSYSFTEPQEAEEEEEEEPEPHKVSRVSHGHKFEKSPKDYKESARADPGHHTDTVKTWRKIFRREVDEQQQGGQQQQQAGSSTTTNTDWPTTTNNPTTTAAAYNNNNGNPPVEEVDEDTDTSSGEGDSAVTVPSPPMMVPVADILNHTTATHNAEIQWGSRGLSIVACRTISKGAEIFNTYGDLPGCELLHMYGFTDPFPHNIYDQVLIPLINVKKYLGRTCLTRTNIDIWWRVLKKHSFQGITELIWGREITENVDVLFDILKVFCVDELQVILNYDRDGELDVVVEEQPGAPAYVFTGTLSLDQMKKFPVKWKAIMKYIAEGALSEFPRNFDEELQLNQQLESAAVKDWRNLFSSRVRLGQLKILCDIIKAVDVEIGYNRP